MSELKSLQYSFPKLRYLIKKRFGSVEKFAEVLDISTVTMYNKLNHKSQFTQSEIAKTQEIFGLTADEVWEIFFTDGLKHI